MKIDLSGPGWVDIATAASLTSQDVIVQCQSDDIVFVWFDPVGVVNAAAVPANLTGIALERFDTLSGNAPKIWARQTGDGAASISIVKQ